MGNKKQYPYFVKINDSSMAVHDVYAMVKNSESVLAFGVTQEKMKPGDVIRPKANVWAEIKGYGAEEDVIPEEGVVPITQEEFYKKYTAHVKQIPLYL